MFFTREDILKIQQALLQLGVKDSELPSAEPVTYDDTLSIVQEGKNKQIGVKDFFNQISLWKREDFLNITDRYDEHYIMLLEAINLVPVLQRKDGLVITFQDTNGDWRIYQFRGNITEFLDEEKWFDLYDYKNYIIKSFLPDEEDITALTPDENGNSFLALKDRVYDPTIFSGKGYKILRKNITNVKLSVTKISVINPAILEGDIYFNINNKGTKVHLSPTIHNTTKLVSEAIKDALIIAYNDYKVTVANSVVTLTRKYSGNTSPTTFEMYNTGVRVIVEDFTTIDELNVITQEDINKSDTIYEIRYDFNLDGKTITIPKNCILYFTSGKFYNGSINMNNTIISTLYEDILSEVSISGNYYNIQKNIKDANNLIQGNTDKLNNAEKNIKRLDTRSTQMEETIKGIAATGGASQAIAVTYNNANSQLAAINVQSAVDELQEVKIDKTSILQESGEAEDKVMSQKVVSTKLGDLSKQLLNSNKIQLYCADTQVPYIEETDTNYVYVYFRGNIVVRVVNNRTLNQTELLTELGVEGVTSPKGIQNCLKISDGQILVYDMTDSKFKLIGRNTVTKEQIKLISVVFGSVNISECRYFLTQWYADRISKTEKNIENINGNITNINSNISNTNATFSTKSVYNKGDIVNYKGVSYIFKLPHTEGEWNTEEVQPISNLSISSLSNLTIENALSSKYDSISIDGDTLTIKKEGFSLFVLGKRITFSGTEDKVFAGTGIRTSLYLNPYYLINNTSVNFTENDDVFVLKQDSVYNGVLFAQWYQSMLMQTGLVAGFKLLSYTNKQITDTNKQVADTNKQLLNSNRIQIYLANNAIPYIEEDRTNSKVYVFLTGNICVRVYGSGRTIQQQALAEEMDVELITSPLGKEKCFVINDGYDFVFDLSDNKFKIISRNLVKANHVVLIINLGGSVNISESKNFLAQWYDKRINEAEKNIEGFESYVDKGKNIRIRNNVALNSDFKAIFFSDVHGASENVRRIKEKAVSWKSQYVDCILNGGDTVQNFNSEGLNWYNQLVQDATIPFISAVGNHDAWSTTYWTWDNNENIYNLLTSKVKEYVPSIVQPTDVDTTFGNYYYYDTEKVRVIVLLSLTFTSSDVYYDEAQDTWLKSVLADAKENNKAVIIMNHGPIDPKDCEEIECNWTSKFSWVNDVKDYQHMDNRILENVDSFIDSGGRFICYLAGHSHLDYILRSKKHPRQMCLVITSARYSYGSDCTRSQSKDNMDYDSYNYIGVDLTHSVIKVQRIGMNTNAWMQEHNTMCWDFKNSKLISDN